jgi:DNA gyrase subunit A
MEPFAKETLPVSLEEEMRRSYLDYAMSVIVGRALPDVRDGLKPVHRRVLFAMHESNNVWNRAYVKVRARGGRGARQVPPARRHRDLRGAGAHGAGFLDALHAGRRARATSARWTATTRRPTATPSAGWSGSSAELLADIDKETVDFVDNYDGKEREPTVLPSRIPNLLLNGSSGHRRRHGDQHPAAQPVRGGGCLPARAAGAGLRDRGADQADAGAGFSDCGNHLRHRRRARGLPHRPRRVVMRARTHFEDIPGKSDRQMIVVDELPYQVNKKALLERIAEQVTEKRLEGISDIRDESDKQGIRVVIELKRGELPEVVLNNLFKQTQLQDTFGMNMVALVDNQPRVLNLKELLEAFISHRREVVTRRTVFELKKARERGHILEGLAVALSNVDDVIELIKKAPSPADAKRELAGADLEFRSGQGNARRVAGGHEQYRPEGLGVDFGLKPKVTGCPRSRRRPSSSSPAAPHRAWSRTRSATSTRR